MPAPAPLSTIRVTVVGDCAVGKTCLLISYVNRFFETGYVPTIFDSYIKKMSVNGENVLVELCDTAGQEQYDRLRSVAYTRSNCNILCYCVDDRRTFEHVKAIWRPEIQHHCYGKPLLLVATKKDLRTDKTDSECVSTLEGRTLARQIKAVRFFECSAKTLENVDEVFTEAVKAAVTRIREERIPRRWPWRCTLL